MTFVWEAISLILITQLAVAARPDQVTLRSISRHVNGVIEQKNCYPGNLRIQCV